jgi:TRAP-type C4-dicarboxylate transport system substrate-binding protein
VHTIAPNVLVSKNLWLGHLYLLTMNRVTWEGLAEEDKLAIQRAAETAYKALGPLMDSSYDAMLDDLRSAGAQVRQLDSKEVAVWETTTKYRDVQDVWVKEQESKGVTNAGAVLKKVTAILSDAVH